MLMSSKNMAEILKLKAELSREFEMKDLGQATNILGMEIQRNRKAKSLKITQASYLDKVIKKFNQATTKIVKVPLAQHSMSSRGQSSKTPKEQQEMSVIPYSNVVGSLMYNMTCTRPDLAQATSIISRFMSCSSKPHREATKWVIRYLKAVFIMVYITIQKQNQN